MFRFNFIVYFYIYIIYFFNNTAFYLEHWSFVGHFLKITIGLLVGLARISISVHPLETFICISLAHPKKNRQCHSMCCYKHIDHLSPDVTG